MKERNKMQKHEPSPTSGSRYIPFQTQEFEEYGRRHFVDF